MIEGLLNEMLNTYRTVSNYEMTNNDDPVVKAELEYIVHEEKAPGEAASVSMAQMSIVINGITVHQVRKLIDVLDTEEKLREELSADLLLSVFGTGLNVFRTGQTPVKKESIISYGGYAIGN